MNTQNCRKDFEDYFKQESNVNIGTEAMTALGIQRSGLDDT